MIFIPKSELLVLATNYLEIFKVNDNYECIKKINLEE